MNLDMLSYLLFLPAMMAIAVGMARACHGRVWMLGIFDKDHAFVDANNNVPLVGCYTLNLGHVAVVTSLWEPIAGWEHTPAPLVHRIALILPSLAAVHFTNIAVLLVWGRIEQHPCTNTIPS